MSELTTREQIMRQVGATFEAMGQSSTPAALNLIADDLEVYGIAAVAKALARCRRELAGRLTPAAILERIQGEDGRPEPNEAWAIALQGADERDTVVLNDEIAAAKDASRDILDAGDEVGARMAFIECYKRVCREAREQGRPVKWWPSLGFDKTRREAPIVKAIEQGRLSRDQVAAALPHLAGSGEPEMSFDRLLSGPSAKANQDKARAVINDMKNLFAKTKIETD